ncbi:class I SAM-dependent methyltransferase [Pseudodesulfovibrio sp. zrk46]|uniref:class I SAM-dependent methyltransferase n=1 Tax=Pseudodesulfovibrio sp. zrk46 TaxID=2725288 RepID=UPI001449A0DC|nr:class I SAM-dependent methyltransferase [Pseudodesulfovibrio sp. zrk46]QJB56567.1 class I SAM-dependent methyltransferase [Pseudodesulfovibrio sp. zrk46]
MHNNESHAGDIEQKKRFRFGKNWRNFLSQLTEARKAEAEKSLRELLEVDTLEGKTFLDIGSGSGLFSLAAARMGAKVRSFDFDPQSVACTSDLKNSFAQRDNSWEVSEGSILDQAFVDSLEQHDIVYSWGVLHHTGDMWTAIDNAQSLVSPGGKLIIALYNDQGFKSRLWTKLKKTYVQSSPFFKKVILYSMVAGMETMYATARAINGKNPLPFKEWKEYQKNRGMSKWYNYIDWIGGYPFEVSRPEEVFNHLRAKGFQLEHLITCGGGHGCNEFVFVKK